MSVLELYIYVKVYYSYSENFEGLWHIVIVNEAFRDVTNGIVQSTIYM